jgi:hypothetical protein
MTNNSAVVQLEMSEDEEKWQSEFVVASHVWPIEWPSSPMGSASNNLKRPHGDRLL